MRHFFHSQNALLRHFSRYTLCGGIAAVVDIGIFYLLAVGGSTQYLVANTVAYCFGMVTNYTLNKVYTFENTSRKVAHQFGLFSIVAAIGFLANMFFIWLLFEQFAIPLIISKIGAVGLTFIVNFTLHRHVTFRWIR